MTIIRTSLGTIESARRTRFEPNSGIAATDVQKAIEEVRADLGGIAWTVVSTPTYEVKPSDRNLWVAANPCTITWPLAGGMTDAKVLVKDGAGGALANNIHNVCTGGQLIDGSADRKITANYGYLKIRRNPTATGYTIVG
jgi:hypothetical protein